MLYIEPISPEALQGQTKPDDNVIPIERAATYKPSQAAVKAVSDPLSDTSWWQGPLDKASGRQTPDHVERHYPKSVDEIMELTKGLM